MASTSPASDAPTPQQKPPGRTGNNNNKYGKNQYKDRPPPDDPHVAELLTAYHRNGINDRREVSKLLLEEHGITLSESSISRRKRKLGLRASHITTQELSESVKIQLILDQMAKDPSGKLGPRMIKQGIFKDTGVQLTRDYIREEMKKLDPVAWSNRGPKHVREKRQLPPGFAGQSTTNSVASSQAAAGSSNATTILHGHPTHAHHPEAQAIAGPSQPPQHPHHAASSASQNQHLSFAPGQHPHMSMNPSMPQQTFPNAYHSQMPQQQPADNQMRVDDDDNEDDDAPDSGHYGNHFQPSYNPPPQDLGVTPAINNHLQPHPHSHTQYPLINAHAPPAAPHPPLGQQSMVTTISLLQETTPKMENLSRFLNSLDADNVSLDADAYHAILQGMESAALLERQLSRIISRTHQHYPRS
ncbi:hypothetical protein NLJ89_g415 [Agrocybe chaxingu]|uniref:Clr5 domain-containing protein n=1 Tax=Agrocybe chaxingu TaxID=84603 RepID=A0A9W8N1V5_9AGAR|nr:hypothetical protein NLJ89_g415 [Agrocybe chaxingu]